MKIEASKHMHKAVVSGFLDKIGDDSPDITYQEFILFYMCRWVIEGEFDPDNYYHRLTDDEPGNWLDKTWSEMKASKTHKREITIPWDKVFDKDNI